jgi:hypothetical protein
VPLLKHVMLAEGDSLVGSRCCGILEWPADARWSFPV